MWIHVLMSSDNSDSAILDSDSDLPTASSLKQLQVVEVMSSIIGDDLIQLLNSLTFTVVKMQKNGKSCLKHCSGPVSHLKKLESVWD
jgi:hypothetical protein